MSNRESGDPPVTTTCSSVACFQDYVSRLGTSERTMSLSAHEDRLAGCTPYPRTAKYMFEPLGGMNVCCFDFYGQDSDDFPVTPIWYVSMLIRQVSRASLDVHYDDAIIISNASIRSCIHITMVQPRLRRICIHAQVRENLCNSPPQNMDADEHSNINQEFLAIRRAISLNETFVLFC